MIAWPPAAMAAAVGGGTFGAGVVATWACRGLARRLGMVDAPDGRLKRQKEAVPLLGGAAVWAAFAAAVFGPVRATAWEEAWVPLGGVFLGATLMMVVGLVDDYKRLGWLHKLLVELILAVLLALSGVRIQMKWFPDAVNYAASALWLVGIANAVNLIDVMDGLATGVCAVASAAFSVIGVLTHNLPLALASAALAGALLGFLPWNWRPAKVYLGDAGSLFVGFTLAAIAMWADYTRENDAAIGAPLLVLGVPIFELGFLIVMRLYARRSPFRGSTDHFALRLRHAGRGEGRIALTSMCLAALLGATGVLVMYAGTQGALVLYGVAAGVGAGAFFVLSSLPAPPEEAA